jgi:hypothetical protein
LHIVGRVTRDLFLYVGNSSTVDVINKTINRYYPLAAPVEINSSAWNDYANSSNSANELECLYRFKDVRRGDRKRAPLINSFQ